MNWTLEDDTRLRMAYSTHSVGEVAVLLGRTVSATRNRCWRLGLKGKRRNWTETELATLREWYATHENRSDFDLDHLANLLSRRKSDVCKKAGELGVTSKGRSISITAKENIGHKTKQRIATNGHPRGALGMRHSQATKDEFSRQRKGWSESWTIQELRARTQAIQQTKLTRYGVAGGAIGSTNPYSRAKRGKRNDLGGVFFRSSWEANYARYLNFLKQHGSIRGWDYEPQVFVFHGIIRGAITYTPDFKVIENDGTHVWHEVKGWMDTKSRTKLRRMAQFYPAERVLVIGSAEYKAIARYAPMISCWES